MWKRQSRHRELAAKLVEWADSFPSVIREDPRFAVLRRALTEYPPTLNAAASMAAIVAANLLIATGTSPRNAKKYLPALRQAMDSWTPGSYEELMLRLKHMDEHPRHPKEHVGEQLLGDLGIRRPYSNDEVLLSAHVGKVVLDLAEEWILKTARE